MANYYFDSSGLVKRYVAETDRGGRVYRHRYPRLLRGAQTVFTSVICADSDAFTKTSRNLLFLHPRFLRCRSRNSSNVGN